MPLLVLPGLAAATVVTLAGGVSLGPEFPITAINAALVCIFPAVFIGAALGLAASALAPDIPPSLAVAAGILGMLLAVARNGWLSLFTAALIVPDPQLLTVLTLVALPARLLCTGRSPMQVTVPT
jgi:H+/Cl- antiporter ClcA